MAWTIEFERDAEKELGKLDAKGRQQVLRYLRDRIAGEENPRRFGKALRGNLSGLWRYRVGSYRIVCQIQDSRLLVLVLRTAHRRSVYE